MGQKSCRYGKERYEGEVDLYVASTSAYTLHNALSFCPFQREFRLEYGRAADDSKFEWRSRQTEGESNKHRQTKRRKSRQTETEVERGIETRRDRQTDRDRGRETDRQREQEEELQ